MTESCLDCPLDAMFDKWQIPLVTDFPAVTLTGIENILHKLRAVRDQNRIKCLQAWVSDEISSPSDKICSLRLFISFSPHIYGCLSRDQ